MTEIMTAQNIIIGGIAVSIVRFLVWKYWTQPRREAFTRRIACEEITRLTGAC